MQEENKGNILVKIKLIFAKVVAFLKDKLSLLKTKLSSKSTGEPEEEIPELYLPETTADLIWLLKKLPEDVLSTKERQILANSMSFSSRHVRDIMTPKDNITFVHENDFMGPLTLDRLYKSGYEHFPVLDTKGGIAGVLHTESLNSLEIRDTDRASSYLDKTVYYMRENYTLSQALAAFLRTNSYFFIVVNQGAQPIGLVTFHSVVEALLGEAPKDDFCQDTDLMAVAKRGLGPNSYIQPRFNAPKNNL